MSPKLLVIADLNMRQRGPCRVAPVCCAGSSVFLPVSPSPVIIIAERALLSSFFLSSSPFFFIRHFPFPVRSIDRHACRKPGNVTSLIIGVVKRVVRNNYEPVPCLVAAYKCVTRALRRAALFRCRWVAVNFKSRAVGEVSDLPCPTRGRCFNFAESNERVCLLHDRKNKRVNYISTD